MGEPISEEHQMEKYTTINYQYRDSGNYKCCRDIAFKGEMTPEMEARLRSAFDAGEYFIAEQIGLPTAFPYPEECDYDPDLDHSWHEYLGYDVVCDTPASTTDTTPMTIEEFVVAVETANAEGWKEYNPEEGYL